MAVCAMMSVAGDSKVESTMILMLGTNEILQQKQNCLLFLVSVYA